MVAVTGCTRSKPSTLPHPRRISGVTPLSLSIVPRLFLDWCSIVPLLLAGLEQWPGAGLAAGEDGGAKGAGVLGEGRDAHGTGPGRFQGADHAGLQRYPPGEADGRRDGSAGQSRDALGNGVLHAGGNLGWGEASR